MEELTKNGIFIAENKETQQLKMFVVGPLSHPENYVETFFELGILHEKYPMIEVNINTPGGDMDTLEELLNGLAKYEHVTTIGRGTIASAGFLLWASGDTRVVGKYSKYMAHRESSSMGGYQKTGESLHYLTTINVMYTEMYKEYLSPILTEEEMKMVEVTEVYIPYTTLLERDVCMSEDTYMKLSDNIKSEEVVTVGDKTYLFNPQAGGWIKIEIAVDEKDPEFIKSILHKMHEAPVEKLEDIDPAMLNENGEVDEAKVKEMLQAVMDQMDEDESDEDEVAEAVEDIIDEVTDIIDSEDEDEDEELETALQDIINANKEVVITKEVAGEKVDVYIDELIEDMKEDILEDPILHAIAGGVISNLLQTQTDVVILRSSVDYLGRTFTIEWNKDDDNIEIVEFITPKKLTREEREVELKKREQDRIDLRAKDFEEEIKRSTEVLESDYNVYDLLKTASPIKSSTRLEGEIIEDVLDEVPEEVLADLTETKERVQENLKEVLEKLHEDRKEDEYITSVESKDTDHKDFISLNDTAIYVPTKFL